ncbi:hypothetical protein GCM10027605_73070 [Micromonospora zhanjiangensis]
MTNIVDKMRDALRRDRWVDADALLDRVRAVDRFRHEAEGHLPDDLLVAAHTVVERAGTRLALSQDHTVVALAGATGSGKSSLFNALARITLSPVGVRRPTTGVAYACVWGHWTGRRSCSTGSAYCPGTGSSGRACWTGTTRHPCTGWCCSTCRTSTR